MKDITDQNDTILLVDEFYARVREDELIGPIFKDQIGEDGWPRHLARMYSFWDAVLLNIQGYHGRPFPKHRDLPIEKRHFERWVSLFEETVRRNFEGAKAEEAIYRANLMSTLFQSKLENIRSGGNFKSIV